MESVEKEENCSLKYIVFDMGSRKYGVAIEKISEIVEGRVVTRVPMTPDCILGVINLRGDIISIVDLMYLTGEAKPGEQDLHNIVIVEVPNKEEQLRVGFVVESVERFAEFSRHDIELASDLTRVDQGVSGIGIVEKEIVTLLDIDQLLSVEKLGRMIRSQARNSGTFRQL